MEAPKTGRIASISPGFGILGKTPPNKRIGFMYPSALFLGFPLGSACLSQTRFELCKGLFAGFSFYRALLLEKKQTVHNLSSVTFGEDYFSGQQVWCLFGSIWFGREKLVGHGLVLPFNSKDQ